MSVFSASISCLPFSLELTPVRLSPHCVERAHVKVTQGSISEAPMSLRQPSASGLGDHSLHFTWLRLCHSPAAPASLAAPSGCPSLLPPAFPPTLIALYQTSPWAFTPSFLCLLCSVHTYTQDFKYYKLPSLYH